MAKEAGSEMKDSSKGTWVPIVISILALVISGASAYWTIVRRSDDVRMVPSGFFFVSRSVNETKVRVSGVLNITITNAGNQSVVIDNLQMFAFLPKDTTDSAKCAGAVGRWTNRALIKGPLIIEPGKLAVVTNNPDSDEVFFDGVAEKEVDISLCVIVGIVTNQAAVIQVGKLLFSGRTQIYEPPSVPMPLNLPGKPIIIYQRLGTIFL
jgi:hypothetical protein